MASDGFYNAKHIDKRLTLPNLQQLTEDGTVYLDNASAVFLDFWFTYSIFLYIIIAQTQTYILTLQGNCN